MTLDPTQFRLYIRMGNAEMIGGRDVADALRETAKKLDDGILEGLVRDANGNSVGCFGFEQVKA